MIHDPERERLRTELRARLADNGATPQSRADRKAWEAARTYLEALFALEDFHIAARKAEADHA